MIDIDGDLLLVGCGRMGGALLQGWLNQRLSASRTVVVEPDPAGVERVRSLKCRCVAAPAGLEEGFKPRVVVFAVKPQMMSEVLPSYLKVMSGGAVCLSIAAGTGIATFEKAFGEKAAVVRAMPNTPAAVGAGMSVLVGNARTTKAQREVCGKLLAAVGEVAWIEDELLLDPVTAVSGSGPAYVFYLVETMAAAGVAAGLPESLAMTLARATVIGSAELMRRSEDSAEQLRRNVTSPGGTTQAALDVLMAKDGLGALMTRAVAAAARRGRELAG